MRFPVGLGVTVQRGSMTLTQSIGAAPQAAKVIGFGAPIEFGTQSKGVYSSQLMKPKIPSVEVTGPGSLPQRAVASARFSHSNPGTPYWQVRSKYGVASTSFIAWSMSSLRK